MPCVTEALRGLLRGPKAATSPLTQNKSPPPTPPPFMPRANCRLMPATQTAFPAIPRAARRARAQGGLRCGLQQAERARGALQAPPRRKVSARAGRQGATGLLPSQPRRSTPGAQQQGRPRCSGACGGGLPARLHHALHTAPCMGLQWAASTRAAACSARRNSLDGRHARACLILTPISFDNDIVKILK